MEFMVHIAVELLYIPDPIITILITILIIIILTIIAIIMDIIIHVVTTLDIIIVTVTTMDGVIEDIGDNSQRVKFALQKVNLTLRIFKLVSCLSILFALSSLQSNAFERLVWYQSNTFLMRRF